VEEVKCLFGVAGPRFWPQIYFPLNLQKDTKKDRGNIFFIESRHTASAPSTAGTHLGVVQ